MTYIYLIYSKLDLELKHVLRRKVLVCVRIYEQGKT